MVRIKFVFNKLNNEVQELGQQQFARTRHSKTTHGFERGTKTEAKQNGLGRSARTSELTT